jgi:hypothetical protein
MKYKNYFISTIIFTLLTSILIAGQHTEEIFLDSDDCGLVYKYIEEGFDYYDIYKENHGTPARRDLRIGLRNNKTYRSFFIYDISDIPDYATIDAVRVLIEQVDSNGDKEILVYGLTDRVDPQNMYNDYTHLYYTFFFHMDNTSVMLTM